MIPFIDLAAQRDRLREQLDKAIAAVLESTAFISGPEVEVLERELAEYAGAAHAVTCANGTDALMIALRALSVGAGDAVFVPSFTFAATAEAVVLAGAVPVFVDCRADTFNLDPHRLEAALGQDYGSLRNRAVIAVDLFGQPADYDAIEPLCARTGVDLIVDAAQSFGSTWNGRRAGTIGTVSTTSFFPAKPLGCYGDGGAVFTVDATLAATLRSLRIHGQGATKYENVRIGTNSRLDTLQAAILSVKLAVLADELAARQRVAERYRVGLGQSVITPSIDARATSAWAQFTVKTPHRDRLATQLKEQGIPTAVYYPIPLHHQAAYAGFPSGPGGLVVSEQIAGQVLSLPMHPYLEETVHDRIIDAVVSIVRG